MPNYQPIPYPEQICAVSILSDRQTPMRSVSFGIEIIDKDGNGLKVIPIKMVTVAITEKDGSESTFSLFPGDARAVSERLKEMADAIEKG